MSSATVTSVNQSSGTITIRNDTVNSIIAPGEILVPRNGLSFFDIGATNYTTTYDAGSTLTYTTFQNAINSALQRSAQPDQVMISESAYRDLQNYTNFTPGYSISWGLEDPIKELRKTKGYKKFHR